MLPNKAKEMAEVPKHWREIILHKRELLSADQSIDVGVSKQLHETF